MRFEFFCFPIFWGHCFFHLTPGGCKFVVSLEKCWLFRLIFQGSFSLFLLKCLVSLFLFFNLFFIHVHIRVVDALMAVILLHHYFQASSSPSCFLVRYPLRCQHLFDLLLFFVNSLFLILFLNRSTWILFHIWLFVFWKVYLGDVLVAGVVHFINAKKYYFLWKNAKKNYYYNNDLSH